MKYQLICMSFDGEYKREPYEFDTIQDTWEYSQNIGSRWYFYPFHFVVRGQTVRDGGMGVEHLINKRIKTVARHFKEVSEGPEMEDCNAEEFWFAL